VGRRVGRKGQKHKEKPRGLRGNGAVIYPVVVYHVPPSQLQDPTRKTTIGRIKPE
jgi:hypothetical protein